VTWMKNWGACQKGQKELLIWIHFTYFLINELYTVILLIIYGINWFYDIIIRGKSKVFLLINLKRETQDISLQFSSTKFCHLDFLYLFMMTNFNFNRGEHAFKILCLVMRYILLKYILIKNILKINIFRYCFTFYIFILKLLNIHKKLI
jgi:hypothetical protein